MSHIDSVQPTSSDTSVKIEQSKTLNTIVGGRPAERVEALLGMLNGVEWLSLSKRLITNGHADVLHGVTEQPDALVLALSGFWKDELEALAERPIQCRPPAIIIGPKEETGVLRLAMRAGARDYLSWPPDRGELVELLEQLRKESDQTEQHVGAEIISVMNAKGGSGATFAACTLAHIMVAEHKQKTALLDLDLQFGNLSAYLDLSIKHSLQEVLEAVEQLDEVAIKGYMTAHASGLEVLGNQDTEPFISCEMDGQRLFALLDLMNSGYDRVVIDLPRILDHMTIQALERSDKVVIVLQQDMASLKDAKRIIEVMTIHLQVPPERIVAVVNRFNKESDISLGDVKTALGVDTVVSIPNDYGRVSESLNTGIPIFDTYRSAKITRALSKLSADLCGKEIEQENNILQNALLGLKGVLKHGPG